RGEGGRDRRRRGACDRPRYSRGAGRKRCEWRGRRGATRPRSGGSRMTSQPRRSEPLPLGDENLPYSKGLMARALIATGVPADQAYGLARRIEVDLAEVGESAATLA